MLLASHFHVRFLCLLALLLLHFPVRSAETSEGAKIYQRRCADCHGERGQGVKDKFDDPLEGDWSLQKLVRYIEKNMPEDDPGTCTGPEAEAVGKYIYDTFYS